MRVTGQAFTAAFARVHAWDAVSGRSKRVFRVNAPFVRSMGASPGRAAV